MVKGIPTTTVNIATSDMMSRQGQNYKINRKIWEAIENGKPSEEPINPPAEDASLEERILALENRAYDDSDVKAKMGYNDIPSGESLMSQINDIKNEIM